MAEKLETVAGFLKPSMELLTYYRQKIVGFEAERAEYLERLAVVERHNGDHHKLRWELRAREEEVAELQKALADAKVILYDEREQVLKLQAENDSLKSQEIEDRKRIQHLLAMTEPVTREATFFRDAVRPPTVASLARARGAAGAQDAAALAAASRPVHTRAGESSAGVGRAGFGIRRPRSPASVAAGGGGAAPAAPAAALDEQALAAAAGVQPAPEESAAAKLSGLGAFALRKQLADMRALEASRAEAYRADRASMRETYERKSANDNVAIAQLEKVAADLQDKLAALTRDYLVQRHTFGLRERAAAEAVAESQAVQMSAEEQAARVSEQSAVETRVLRGAADQQSRALQHFVSSSERAREEDRRVAAAQHAAQAGALQAELAACRAQLRHERERYAALQQRRALEIEGFNADIKQLRDAMRRVEKHWSLVHGAVADAALVDQVAELERAYASIAARTAAAAAISDPASGGPPPPLPLQLSAQQLQRGPSRERPPASRGDSNGGGDPVNASRPRSAGGSSHWAGLVFPPKQSVEPASGSYAVQDAATRARLRGKDALLQDHPIVYRVVRTSGYRQDGHKGAVDGDFINERARSAVGPAHFSQSRSNSRGASAANNVDHLRAAALLTDLLGNGAEGYPGDLSGNTALLPPSRTVSYAGSTDATGAAGTALEATSSPQVGLEEETPGVTAPSASPTVSSTRSIGGPRRVPSEADASGGPRASEHVASELEALKQRVATMATLAERTAAVLVR